MKFKEYYDKNKNTTDCLLKLLECRYWIVPCTYNGSFVFSTNEYGQKTLNIFTELDEYKSFLRTTGKSDSNNFKLLNPKKSIKDIEYLMDLNRKDFLDVVILDLVVFDNCIEANIDNLKTVYDN